METELEDMYNATRCDECGSWHSGGGECEDCKRVEEKGEEYEVCELCNHKYTGVDCPCLSPRIQNESAERIRYLMSLGHPCEHDEHYSRWMIMEECQRRGKQLLIDLGWPVEPDSVYRNKYVGSKSTLRQLVYHYCMEKEKGLGFEEMLNDRVWSVVEHNWPLDKFDDSEMFPEYKNKLDYINDVNGSESMSVEDYEEDDDEDCACVPQTSKVEDKSQTTLGDW